MKYYFAIIPLLILTALSCKKNSDSSKVPSITFGSMAPDSVGMTTMKYEDTVVMLTFKIIDGDGDLGNDANSGKNDIFLIDSRNPSSAPLSYPFPSKTKNAIDPAYGMNGECLVKIPSTSISMRPDHPDEDTVRYEVYIKDRADHESNHFTTPLIHIFP
jgi:hypothetical protein